MRLTAKFVLERETAHKVRFSEKDATHPLVGVLYLDKDAVAQAYRADMTAMPDRWPVAITMTIEWE